VRGASLKSALEGDAEKVAMAPDQAAPANGAEIVEGQCEVQRHHREAWRLNSCAAMGQVADRAGMLTRFAERQTRRFDDQCSADRSAIDRAFPLAQIRCVEHPRNLVRLGTKPLGGV
jgi:hypothetical protein